MSISIWMQFRRQKAGKRGMYKLLSEKGRRYRKGSIHTWAERERPLDWIDRHIVLHTCGRSCLANPSAMWREFELGSRARETAHNRQATLTYRPE